MAVDCGSSGLGPGSIDRAAAVIERFVVVPYIVRFVVPRHYILDLSHSAVRVCADDG